MLRMPFWVRGDLGGLGLVPLGSQATWDHLTGGSPYGAQPESTSQQTDLARVDRLVQGAKEQRAEFDRVGRIGHLGRFQEQFGGSLADKPHRIQVDPFEQAEHGLAVRMGTWIVRGFCTP